MVKVSKQWLQEWLDVEIPIEQLVEQLTMAGLEVDGFSPVAGNFSEVIVAEVLKVEPHPQADKLRICQVNAGEQYSTLTIVCGAPNVYEGMKTPLAVVGASLPQIQIKKAKLRGVESEGMLCSSKELGLSETSDGILNLPSDAPVGKDLREYLQLDDITIDVELTSNRGDCASVRGIAREVAAINRCKYLEPKIKNIQQVI